MVNLIQIFPLKNFDLLTVGITIAAIGILGFLIYLNNKESITNKTFFLFSLVTIAWSFFNYINYQIKSPEIVLWLLRTVIFFGVWHSFTFFQFFYVFPEEKKSFPKWYRFLLLPYVVLVSILTLTPFVFSGIAELSIDGSVSKTVVEKGIIFFASTVILLILSGIVIFVKKLLKAPIEQKNQYKLILTGTILTFFLLFTFNLILPAIFSNVRFVPLGALFIFPFVGFTSYAIYKHKLFNLKVGAIAFVAFILTIFSFFNILYAKEISQVVLNTTFFAAILLGSIILIRSVLKEIEQREHIEKLAKELEIVNGQQESLLHFIGHEIKGYFTKSHWALSSMLDGDYGQIAPDLQALTKQALDDTKQGIDMVESILKAGNLKKGTVSYEMKPFDFKGEVKNVIEMLKSNIESKKLTLEMNIDESQDYTVNGDGEQISKHVLRNLIDNAIKYTPKGNVKVSLSKKDGKVLFSVKDSGVGITPEDKARLFTEGGRGKDSVKVNVHSTGYGLYIAKQIVDAHKGRIWVESEGAGKGSTFFVEI